MIHPSYPYLEEVNDGILRQFRRRPGPPGLALDVGCGRGQLGEAIQRLGWRVWGIEQHAEACAVARLRLERVLEADLQGFERLEKRLDGTAFDALVFSDVLEHVAEPEAVVAWYLKFLRPGGTLLISVPNFLVWTNRLALLLGVVRQTDSGVMDRTHLRLFTFRLAKKLVRAAGCGLVRADCTPHLLRAGLPIIKKVMGLGQGAQNPRVFLESPRYQWYQRYIYPMERALASLWRTLLAFRIIVVGVKSYEPEA